MNTKTTLALFVVLLAAGGVLWLQHSTAKLKKQEEPAAPAAPTSAAAQKVFEKELGEIVKVTVAKGGAEPLTFEKRKEGDSSAPANWYVTAPFESKATTWEIDRIPRDIGQLSYEISYKPGESGGVTGEQAGLAPPVAVITLTNAEGKETKVEVGKPASSSETYVRVAGAESILVAKSRLADLFKKDAAEYRDAQVWSFEPAKVKRVEIVDRSGAAGSTGGQANGGTPSAGGSPTTYVFVRDGAKWMMESPVTAKATDKVEEALKTVSRLRVLKWEPQAQSRVVGLDPAAITATFTVEEQVPVAKEAPKEGEGETEEPAEPAMETKTTVHTLHLSNLSPIGEDTKTYVRVGDAPAVATIMKTVADKLKPVMGEWREMRLITDDVPRASKIELTVGGESAVLNKNADGWQFEGGGAADDEAVSKLLEAVQKLQAVVFVESPEASAAQAGLASPRATIAVTIPGVEGAKRITIGGYTDEQTKRMAYVRRDDADALAKVMEAELAPLLRGPSAYQNRTVLSIAPAELRRFAISRVNPFTKERENVALELVDGAWQMKEPIGALGRQPKAQELVDAVAALQAERVVPAAEAAAVSQALQEPDAVLTITHQPASASPDGAPDATVEAPAPEATKTLAIAVHNGKPYGKLADRPSIYELPGAFVEKTKAEYRDGSVLKFNPEEVTTFSVKEGAVTHTFARGNDKWTYEAEPDLPLDHSKVENLLGQFQNLSTDAFVVHATADQGLYGLPEPEREIRIEVAGGKELVLSISGMSSQVPAVSGRFAASSATPGVFVLSESVLQALRVDLDALGAS